MKSFTLALSQLAYKIHPKLGEYYMTHPRFFNDGFVELVCLLIANVFFWFFSYLGFMQVALVMLTTLVATPITFCLKYLLHKYWVWRQ